MTPVEACLRRSRVIRCVGRILARRDRVLSDLRGRAFVTGAHAERLRREFDAHERRMVALALHFEALGEVALRGGATVH